MPEPRKVDVVKLAEAFAKAPDRNRRRAIDAAKLAPILLDVKDREIQAARVFFDLGQRGSADYGVALADFAEALKPSEREMLAAAGGGPTAEDEAVARAMGLSPEAVAAERGRMQVRDHLGGDPREVEAAAAKVRMNAR